jgi:hypothetical protein
VYTNSNTSRVAVGFTLSIVVSIAMYFFAKQLSSGLRSNALLTLSKTNDDKSNPA